MYDRNKIILKCTWALTLHVYLCTIEIKCMKYTWGAYVFNVYDRNKIKYTWCFFLYDRAKELFVSVLLAVVV